MGMKLIEDTQSEPISPLIDVVANAMAAMFIMLVVYMALTAQPKPPPIITISEAEGLRFPSGSAELTDAARLVLVSAVVPIVRKHAAECRCDILEVIGHTDGQELRAVSNLDRALDVKSGSVAPLIPGSNTDLGLLRAWSVIGEFQKVPGFAGMRFYGYSAGQTILPHGELAGNERGSEEESRRRIEIRLRRSVSR